MDRYGPLVQELGLHAILNINNDTFYEILENCRALNKLTISTQDALTNISFNRLNILKNLKQLIIKELELSNLEMMEVKNLVSLEVSNIDTLEKIELRKLPYLKHLDIYRCVNLTNTSIKGTPLLEELGLNMCPKVYQIADLVRLKNLKHLRLIRGKNLDKWNLPKDISIFTK